MLDFFRGKIMFCSVLEGLELQLHNISVLIISPSSSLDLNRVPWDWLELLVWILRPRGGPRWGHEILDQTVKPNKSPSISCGEERRPYWTLTGGYKEIKKKSAGNEGEGSEGGEERKTLILSLSLCHELGVYLFFSCPRGRVLIGCCHKNEGESKERVQRERKPQWRSLTASEWGNKQNEEAKRKQQTTSESLKLIFFTQQQSFWCHCRPWTLVTSWLLFVVTGLHFTLTF